MHLGRGCSCRKSILHPLWWSVGERSLGEMLEAIKYCPLVFRNDRLQSGYHNSNHTEQRGGSENYVQITPSVSKYLRLNVEVGLVMISSLLLFVSFS